MVNQNTNEDKVKQSLPNGQDSPHESEKSSEKESVKSKRYLQNIMLICLNEEDTNAAKYHGLRATHIKENIIPTKSKMQELDEYARHLVLVTSSEGKAKRNAYKILRKYDLPNYRIPKDASDTPIKSLSTYLTQLNDIEVFCDEVKNCTKAWVERKMLTTYENEGKYKKAMTIGRGKNARTILVEVSDFVFKCNGLIIGSKKSELIVTAIKGGKEQEFAIDTDDFIGIGKLKSIMTKKGYFFRPESADIDSILYLTTRFAPHYKSLEILGQQSDCFVLENGVIMDGAFLPKNKHNIVGNYHLSIEKEKDRPVSYKAASKINLGGFLAFLVTIFGKEKAYTGFAMIVASLFYDIIERTTSFPILNAYGKPETGKSTFVRRLMALFTQKILFKSISLSGNGATKVGIKRALAQIANIPLWFDEYKNDIDKDMLRMLRNIFDGAGRVTGAYTNDNKTNNSSVLRPIIISGEHPPTKEPALMSRCIMLNFETNNHTAVQLEEMHKLESEMEQGLSHLLVELLQYRTPIAEKFSRYYNKRRREIYKESQARNSDLSTRTCSLFAVPLTVMEILFEQGLTLGADIDFMDFYTVMFDLAFKQNALKTETTAVNIFWEFFGYMLDNSLLVEKQDYRISEADNELWLASGTFNKYIQHYRRVHNENPLDKPTLQGYLKSEDYYIGYSNKTMDIKQRKVYRFNLKQLRDLELISKGV